MADSTIGVTIVTGFLGSGKSTLIRRILTEKHDMRLVVVENEFSSTSTVESAIVSQGIGTSALEQFIELPNGCICCQAQDDLTESLSRLLRARPGEFDHVLIEASGLADPGPVAANFWVDEELETGLKLDAVVTVVDAVNVGQYLKDGDGKSEKARITLKQIVVADLVLLNKVDLLENDDDDDDIIEKNKITKVESKLRQAGCNANIIRTRKCDVDLSLLMNINAYDEETSEAMLTNGKAPEKFEGHLHFGVSDVGNVTFSIMDALFDGSMLDGIIGEMLWENEENGGDGLVRIKREIWRMKALVEVEGEQFKRIYQSVDTLFDGGTSSVAATKPISGRRRESFFIFIGKGLKEVDLRANMLRATINKHCT